MRKHLLFTIIVIIFVIKCPAQIKQDSTIIETTNIQNINGELKGMVLDADKQTALPYASIFILHKNKGVISNEKGAFSINISGLDKTDTLSFQYIGYKTRYLSVGQLDTFTIVNLKVQIINLDEIYVFGNAPDPEFIVKQVLKNKDSNYKKTTSKRQTFIRERDISDINELNLIYKKSSIPDLDNEMLKSLEEKIPRHVTSYTDFLGDIYFTQNQEDSVKLKINPVRTVSLKEKDIAELEQFESLFDTLLKNTGDKEYWQIKSGIFGEKLSKDDINPEPEKDTLKDNKREVRYFGNMIRSQLQYTLMNDKDQWEFLYNTGQYDYTLAGGAGVNEEDVYIIDFKPHHNGHYAGRMYISTNTFALIRADYEYAPGKTGRDIQLLGIGYTETQFAGSIFFEKKDNNYILKYFSKKEAAKFSINRDLALYQKKKRFLWDEKENEFKIELNMKAETEGSFEFLVLDFSEIPEEQFKDFKQPDNMEIIYVDQFDDKLWSGYPIIEPTRQMKDYKKQDFKYGE
jgi:hypothetical protein